MRAVLDTNEYILRSSSTDHLANFWSAPSGVNTSSLYQVTFARRLSVSSRPSLDGRSSKSLVQSIPYGRSLTS